MYQVAFWLEIERMILREMEAGFDGENDLGLTMVG